MAQQLLDGKGVLIDAIGPRREPVAELVHGPVAGQQVSDELAYPSGGEVAVVVAREGVAVGECLEGHDERGRDRHHALFLAFAMHEQGVAYQVVHNVVRVHDGDFGAA